jgi:hypothetical protein
MKLTIVGSIPEGSSINIQCNHQTQTLYSFDNKVVFDIPESEHNITITMEGCPQEINYTCKHIIVFLLTALFQGIWNIIIMNNNSEWYKEAAAYRMTATCDFCKSNDMDFQMNLSESKWSKSENTWLCPEMKIFPNPGFKIHFEKQPQSIKNAFFNYTKRMLSFITVIVCILIVLFVISTLHHITAASAIIIFLMVSLSLLTGWSILHECKRCKRLVSHFILNS